MPVWLIEAMKVLSTALSWIQSSTAVTIIAIIQEILSFLLAAQPEKQEDAAKELLAHVKKITCPKA